MDRKYLSAPFDMSEYIFGKRFTLGGRDFDLEEKLENEKSACNVTPSEKKQKISSEEPQHDQGRGLVRY
jgi:hypothetical protein